MASRGPGLDTAVLQQLQSRRFCLTANHCSPCRGTFSCSGSGPPLPASARGSSSSRGCFISTTTAGTSTARSKLLAQKRHQNHLYTSLFCLFEYVIILFSSWVRQVQTRVQSPVPTPCSGRRLCHELSVLKRSFWARTRHTG